MSRAHGKNSPRKPADPEHTPEQRAEYGLVGTGTIPGPPSHIINYPTVTQKPAAAAHLAEFRGQMAHGVPPDGLHWDRPNPDGRKPADPYGKPPGPVPPSPVPVYIVNTGGGAQALHSAAPRHYTLNASTGDPIRLCGKSPDRTGILLLNEDGTHDIRFAQKPGDLVGGGGALISHLTTSYLRLATQDELWAVSADTGTPVLSVIQEFVKSLPW